MIILSYLKCLTAKRFSVKYKICAMATFIYLFSHTVVYLFIITHFFYIYIHGTGNDSNAFLIGIFCGSNIPKDMVSEKNVIYIEFKSDDTVESKGFRISYTAGKGEDLINDSKQNETKSQQTLTTVIVGGIIGGLVLITGIVVTICICASSRRCTCRPGSRTVNPYSNTERELSSNRRTNVLTRTDTFSYGEATRNTALPHVESPIFEYPFQINPPTYSESSSPPPYNGHEVIELQRLPSSPPPPYSTYDPNSFAGLGDISVPSLPGQTTFRI